MQPIFTPAYKSLSQVGFLRVYRARGLAWRSGVVLHDSCWVGPRKIVPLTIGRALRAKSIFNSDLRDAFLHDISRLTLRI
jgi:hypothetical protein